MTITNARNVLLFLTIAAIIGVTTASAQTVVPATSPYDATTMPSETDGASPPPADGGWNFHLSIPLWIPGLDGDVTVKGNEFSPDQDTGDVIDDLDRHFNGAFALHFEAEKDRFGLFADAMYLDLRADSGRARIDAEAEFKGFIGELGAFYTVIAPEPGKRGWGAFRLDALGGMRITAIELGVNTDVSDVSTHETLFDPIIGVRGELGLTNWLSLQARGDVGGFGIDAWNTSDFSFNVQAGLDFRLAKWFDLGLGYRWLKYDFEPSDNSTFDATLSGPYVAMTFNF